MRNPGRTAVAAAALMIGIALVAFSAVLASGLRSATTGALDEQVRGDYVVVNEDDWSPIDPGAVAAVREVQGVRTAEGLVQGRARAFGEPAKVDGVDPERIADVFGWEWQQGSDADLAKLAGGGAVVTDLFAEKHGLAVGERFSLATPAGGRMQLTVAGISKPDRFDPLLLGDVTIARDAFAGTFPTERERFGFVDADASARPAIERALAPYADAALQTKEEFKTAQAAWVDQILAIFYLLLGLAVIVSLFGIVNTMALSVVERTRELGMLRAIGMTRRQMRRMVRHESIVTALIGAVLGIGAGLALGALAAAALSEEGLRFSVPVGSLVAFTVVAALAGVLAAMGPARRASRLDVIRALEYE
jgi:putative ABC transport system permease protein